VSSSNPTQRGSLPDTDPRIASAIASAKAGDSSAVHYLYVRYADEVHAYVQSILQDRSDAERVVQRIFAELPTTIAHYDATTGSFTGWLRTVADIAARRA